VNLRFHWFLPASGDGQAITGRGDGSKLTDRPPDLEYLTQVARSAERLGFEAVLTPVGTWCEDAWLVTLALISQTERLKFLVAFQPGQVSPTRLAQMAATYQWISGGRLLLNVITGGQAGARFGGYLWPDQQYARTAEFLAIVRGAWTGRSFDLSGEHYQVRGATVMRPPEPAPSIYFGGSCPAAGPVAARYADVYLTWGEPPGQVAEDIARVRDLAQAEERGGTGRAGPVRFGIRLPVITRDTQAQAWAEADRVCPELRARASLDHPGAGRALVGSHEQVADLIEEYASLGIEEFILSGYPHLKEAYWFGEGVLPVLRNRGVAGPQQPAYAV
jgi:alkanesulfonate monooxygenase